MSAGEIDNDYYWKLLQYRVQEKRIAALFDCLNRERIEAVIIKGWAAAQNYPRPFERLSVDIDAAVKPESYAAVEALLTSENITGVDLHKGLSRLDTVAWENLYNAARTTDVGGTAIKVLRAEDHLRILCVHWLGDGGADRERLRDVYYAVENRPADFDWARCLDAAGAKRRRWVVCTIGLAEKYLGLDIKDTPIAAEAKQMPGWLIETVEREWKRGVRLKPLHRCVGEREDLYEQIKLRIPPNPVQATVDVEGEFDDGSRIKHQIRSVLLRLKPSLKRIGGTIRRR